MTYRRIIIGGEISYLRILWHCFQDIFLVVSVRVKCFTHLNKLDISESLGILGCEWQVEPLFPSRSSFRIWILPLDNRHWIGDRQWGRSDDHGGASGSRDAGDTTLVCLNVRLGKRSRV